jgi:thiol-disulfide isomerase/thioredoxin
MKKTYYLFLSLFILSLTFSCDVIEKDNFTDPNAGFPWLGKKVLIEDFTGFKCTNCPDASAELHKIEELYPDKVIGIAIHAGSFAEPSGVFVTDFRTNEGNEITDFFGPEGFPIGMVNRQGYPDNVLLSYTDWASQAGEQLLQAPTIELSISKENNTVSVQARRLSESNNSLKLVVCITEDGIIDKQIDGGELIEEYEHNHVLRKVINGAWGSNIQLSSTSSTYSYDYTLENSWVRSNCNIVAFVYDNSNKEILQVEKIHLTD